MGFVVDVNHVMQQFTIGLNFSCTNTLLEHNSFIKIDVDVDMHPRTPPHFTTPVPESISFVVDNVSSDHAGDGLNSSSQGECDLMASSSMIDDYLLGLQ